MSGNSWLQLLVLVENPRLLMFVVLVIQAFARMPRAVVQLAHWHPDKPSIWYNCWFLFVLVIQAPGVGLSGTLAPRQAKGYTMANNDIPYMNTSSYIILFQ